MRINFGDLGQRLAGVVGVEGPDHRQAAREGLHVAVAGLQGGVGCAFVRRHGRHDRSIERPRNVNIAAVSL